jgi:hypothetical protein
VGAFSFDEALGLDAIVGSPDGIEQEPPLDEHHIAVFVHGVSGADAMGLADDAKLLIEAFVRDPTSFDRETRTAARPPDPEGGLEIALHGLSLGPEDEHVLRSLLHDLVAGRRVPRGPRDELP